METKNIKFWLTTHWPQSIRDGHVEPHEGVWVQDGKEKAIEPVDVGDLVLIYESKHGLLEEETPTDGKTVAVPRKIGRQGIVALVEVTSRPVEILYDKRIKYVKDRQKWWRYHAPTHSVNSQGFVSKDDIRAAMNWPPLHPMRAIGRLKSGLQELSHHEYRRLESIFLSAQPSVSETLDVVSRRATYGSLGGGEGSVHRALKTRVAADPANVLGEPGLRCVRVEFPFATNDRVDIVLQDRFGRYVMVEVEVDCDANHVAGALQCMKYRAMWAYLEGRPVEEVRTMLVAHSMADTLLIRAQSAGIECKKVPRPL